MKLQVKIAMVLGALALAVAPAMSLADQPADPPAGEPSESSSLAGRRGGGGRLLVGVRRRLPNAAAVLRALCDLRGTRTFCLRDST